MTHAGDRLPPDEQQTSPAADPPEPADSPLGAAGKPYTAFPANEAAAEPPVSAEVVVAQTGPLQSLPQPHFGWALLLTIGLFLFQILFSIVVGIAVVALVVAAGGGNPGRLQEAEFADRLAVWLVPVATFSNLVFALIVAGVALRKRFFRHLGLRNMAAHQWALVLLLVAPQAIVASEIGNWASRFLPSFDLEIPPEFANGPWIVVFLAGCLLPGVGEEIFFRGYLSRGLVARHGLIGGALLASLLFGLVHANPPQVVGTFVLGLGMQFVFLATKSLTAPILLHTLNNAGAFLVMRLQDEFPIPGLNVVAEEGVVHTPPALAAAALAATAVVAYLLYQTRTRWLLSGGVSWSPGYVTAEQPPGELGARPDYAAPNLPAAGLAIVCLALTAYFIYQANASYAG